MIDQLKLQLQLFVLWLLFDLNSYKMEFFYYILISIYILCFGNMDKIFLVEGSSVVTIVVEVSILKKS
jgi:hypothetical protein